MSKIFITLLIAACICATASAQIKNNVEFGVNVGYNNAYVQESGTYNNTDLVSGFNAGFSAEYYFSDRWGIKGKVIYDQKGWGNGFLDLPDGSTVEGVNFKLNYITIPVMANWHFGRTRNWYLNFGPYAGFLVNANAGGIDVKQVFNSTDFGLDLGIGVKIPVSNNTKFFIEYDAQAGVSNIFNSSSDGSSVQNNRSSINIGLAFSMR